MKTKKTPRADLEKKKILFLEIGFVITLCVVLYSFEWGYFGNLTVYGNNGLYRTRY